jgi:voltage-gated sodium channel type II alpha
MVNAFLRSMRMLTDVLALSLFFISTFALVGMQLFVGVLRNKCVLSPGQNVTDFQVFVANESKFLFQSAAYVLAMCNCTCKVQPY